MLNLIRCEFQKLKRKKFIQLTLAAAFLFPIPLTILMAKDKMAFDQLFRANMLMGDLLLLPGVLGVVASMLFFMERDNDTLKNLLTIPVSKTKLLLAKLSVLLILSVLYSVAGLGATLIGGVIVGNVEGVLYRLLLSLLIGIFVLIATLPVIVVIVAKNKSYIFSVIISFAYAIVGFAITMMFGTNPEAVNSIASILPVPIIIKWYLGSIPLEETLSYVLPYTITTHVTDITPTLLRVSLSQIVGVGFFNFLAVAPVIAWFARKRNGFFTGVGLAFFYGFCGIFVAGRKLTDFYPVTAGLGIIQYTGQEDMTYNPIVGSSILFCVVVLTTLIVAFTPPYDKVMAVPEKKSKKKHSAKNAK